MGKFVSPCPPPTAREREITEIIAEECNEVAQRAMKLLRFGVDEVQPGHQYNNAYRMGLEIGDVLEIVDMAVSEGLVPAAAIKMGREKKRAQLAKYMQTDPSVSETPASADTNDTSKGAG